MRIVTCTALAVLLLSTLPASAQHNFELGTGFVYVSGNQGLDGFDAGMAIWFSRRVAGAFDYDMTWDNSRLGLFETTQVGLTTVKSRLQNYLFGPRFSVPGLLHSAKINGNVLLPFIEVQMGPSHLKSTITQASGAVGASDTAFSWMFGGGADIKVSPKWVGRIKVDLLRTHFASAGQSRVRFGLGVAHTFRNRED